MSSNARNDQLPLISVDEFRLLINVRAFLPQHPLADPVAFLKQHYAVEEHQDRFLEHGAVAGTFHENQRPVTDQRILFYPHWGGHRAMQIVYLKAGGRLTLLVDRESVEQANRFGWDDFFRGFGDIRWIVAEEPMAARQIYRDLAAGRSIGVSIDGNRGSTPTYLTLPFSPFAGYRFRLGGLKLAARTKVPVAYMAASLDNPARVRLVDIPGESAETLGTGLLAAFRQDLNKTPHAWKLWKRASRDHIITPNPNGLLVCVRFKSETYLGNTGTGKLLPLQAKSLATAHRNGRDYLSWPTINNDIKTLAG